jgi:hypothetical protein
MKGDLLLLIHGTKSGEKREKKEKKLPAALGRDLQQPSP